MKQMVITHFLSVRVVFITQINVYKITDHIPVPFQTCTTAHSGWDCAWQRNYLFLLSKGCLL